MTPTATRSAVRAGRWTVDPDHTCLEFLVKYMGIVNVRGRFSGFDGAFEIDDDGCWTVSGGVQAATVSSGVQERDEKVRSEDFLDAEHHPRIEFRSDPFTPDPDNAFDVSGTLTLRGESGAVTFETEMVGAGTDIEGNDRLGVTARTTIDRRDFGVKFHEHMGSGNVLVGNNVKLELHVSAVRDDDPD